MRRVSYMTSPLMCEPDGDELLEEVHVEVIVVARVGHEWWCECSGP